MEKNVYQIKKALENFSDKDRARSTQKFFKYSSSEDRDIFLGVTVPQCRKIALKYADTSMEEIESLLKSSIHEERLIAFLLLCQKFAGGEDSQRQAIFDFLLDHITSVNNWDLVDLVSPNIIGQFLLAKPRDLLYNLVYSKSIWQRRIAIVSTLAFVKKGQLADTFKISELLITDSHDLIQKAVGWLLREAGKKDEALLVEFLKSHYPNIARTTIRYAIEKFDPDERKRYLKGEFGQI